jgi:hypothetical protein
VKGHVHYEAAFEDYIRSRGTPYVAVDEAKRAAFREAKLKSFDFIVYAEGTANWLVDIKGRRWGARRNGRATWENWATEEDLIGLERWQRVFGAGFRGLLVFAYWIQAEQAPPVELVHTFRHEQYIFCGVPLDDYRTHARVRSPKWGTVSLPRKTFAELVRPMGELV